LLLFIRHSPCYCCDIVASTLRTQVNNEHLLGVDLTFIVWLVNGI